MGARFAYLVKWRLICLHEIWGSSLVKRGLLLDSENSGVFKHASRVSLEPHMGSSYLWLCIWNFKVFGFPMIFYWLCWFLFVLQSQTSSVASSECSDDEPVNKLSRLSTSPGASHVSTPFKSHKSNILVEVSAYLSFSQFCIKLILK